MDKNPETTLDLFTNLARERGLLAFAIVFVETDEADGYVVRATSGSRLDETTDSGKLTIAQMAEGVATVLRDMGEGRGRVEFLN